ncbi:antibiotic biosynthesis monooxygenase family protein [Actinoalloteichus spitiensis]|uniref:antibiotic biosynthesis monooxygenase family protein n=1 Tax=Actinoalloteichus spitiensis TaxID=252394 RepID=UPI0012F6DA51|nr:antibiotic biosynthesis monooxygenase family protein [Actinoalloteichus spitiensis]
MICPFDVPDSERTRFAERAERALRLLSDQSGCLDARLARATEDARRWVLVARFESVTAYRRALSPFEVREHVVPLLAEALPAESAVYEVLAEGEGGVVTRSDSLLADDAGTVRLGEAAGPEIPRR